MMIRSFSEFQYAERRYSFRSSNAVVFSKAGFMSGRKEIFSANIIAALPDGIEHLFPKEGYDRYMLLISNREQHVDPSIFKFKTEKLQNNRVLVYQEKKDREQLTSYLIGTSNITQLMDDMKTNFETGLFERQALKNLAANIWPDFQQKIEKIDSNRWYLRN